jgi:hypothetical protein
VGSGLIMSEVRQIIKNIIEEGYDYSSTQFQCPESVANKVKAYKFNEDDLYYFPDGGGGKETDIHCTVLYGLHDATPSSELKEYFSGVKPFKVNLGKISYFENKDFDVMKIDVDSDELRHINSDIKANFDNTQTYDEYNPHVTIAYIKKGYDRSNIDEYAFSGESFEIDSIEFSSKSGKKYTIKL